MREHDSRLVVVGGATAIVYAWQCATPQLRKVSLVSGAHCAILSYNILVLALAQGAMLGGNAELHFIFVDKVFRLRSGVGRFALLQTDLIYLFDQRVSQARPQSQNVINDPLLEGVAPWVNVI